MNKSSDSTSGIIPSAISRHHEMPPCPPRPSPQAEAISIARKLQSWADASPLTGGARNLKLIVEEWHKFREHYSAHFTTAWMTGVDNALRLLVARSGRLPDSIADDGYDERNLSGAALIVADLLDTCNVHVFNAEEAAAEEAAPRLTVNIARNMITLDKKPYSVTREQAELVQKLLEVPGARVPCNAMTRTDGGRPDRIKNGLPLPIRKLIDSKRGYGGGLRLVLPLE